MLCYIEVPDFEQNRVEYKEKLSYSLPFFCMYINTLLMPTFRIPYLCNNLTKAIS